MRIALLALSVTLLVSESFAQELTKEQMEPWSTLKRQVGLYFERNWEEHDKFIHPKIVDWGDSMPSPIHFGGEAKKYYEQVENGAEKVVAFHLVPVSVVVAGDVAIINAHLHALTKPDGKSVERPSDSTTHGRRRMDVGSCWQPITLPSSPGARRLTNRK